MTTSVPDDMNSNCASLLESNYPLTGYPTFMIADRSGGYNITTVSAIYDSFYLTEPIASPAAYYSFEGRTLSVATKTKFWEDTSGDYYLTANVVEDNVTGTQNGKEGTVLHRNLLRGSMATDYRPFGDLISTGSVVSDTVIDKNFKMTLPPSWNIANVHVIIALYQKIGIRYYFVNCAKATLGTTSNELSLTHAPQVKIFPNPVKAHESVHIEIEFKLPTVFDIELINIFGQKVYQSNNYQKVSGHQIFRIPTEHLKSGFYYVVIKGENINHSQLLVVN